MKLFRSLVILAAIYGGTADAQQISGLSTGGGGGGGTGGSVTDPSSWTSGTSLVVPNGGLYQTTRTSNPLSSGQLGTVQLTQYRAMQVNLTNASGVEIGTNTTPLVASISGVGGAADESAFTFGSSFFPNGVVYQTTATSNALTNGTYGMVQGTAYRAQHVNLRTAAGVEIGTSGSPLYVSSTAGGLADEASFTFGTTIFPTGVVYQTSATSNALTNGQVGQLQGTANRAAFVNLRTAAGTEIGTSGSPVYVNNTPGALVDEATYTAGTSIAPNGVLYQTTATTNALSNGQVGQIQGTANRAAFVNLRTAAGAEIGTSGSPVFVNATPGALVDQGAYTAGTSIAPTGVLYQTTATSNALSNGQVGQLQGTANRAAFVNLRTAAGTEIGTTTTPVFVTPQPSATSGVSVQSAIVAANTTSVAVGSSAAHTLFGIDAYSISASTPVYIKLYNTAQGSVTCGSGTPVARYVVPAIGGATGSGQIWHDTNGIAFSTALTYCITAGIADNDTTAPAASSYLVNLVYK